MPRRRSGPLPVPTWKCPHCDFIHTPADLQRIGFNTLKCKACSKTWQVDDGKKRTS